MEKPSYVMPLDTLQSMLNDGTFHHATYRNIGTLWEGLHIYCKSATGFRGYDHAGVFPKSDPELDKAFELCRGTGECYCEDCGNKIRQSLRAAGHAHKMSINRAEQGWPEDVKVQITAQVLNGATGEVREVVANVKADSEQDAVNKLFAVARRDDFYYRFMGMDSVIEPKVDGATPVVYETQTYWALEA